METMTENLLELRQQLRKNEEWRDVDFSSMLTEDLREEKREEGVRVATG